MQRTDDRLHLTVGQGGSIDYPTLQAAINAVPWNKPATIHLQPGIYREKIYCDKQDIHILGEDKETVLLQNGDGAYHIHPDGRKNGTFRSYTAFFKGETLRVENLTIANTAGSGRIHGQGIAAAVETARACFENVVLLGSQDTLFTGPLPEKERQPDGFLGPSQHTERVQSCQHYRHCTIKGDVDFIFGGATALFEECLIRCRGEVGGGYIAAPSTPPGEPGYVFYRCRIEAAGAARHSFYLARPWREYGAAAFVECEIADVIHPDGFDDWDSAANRTTSRFAEYGSTGGGALLPRAFGTPLNAEAADELLKQARNLCGAERLPLEKSG